MRRSFAAALVALSTGLAVLPATAPAAADETAPPAGLVDAASVVPGEELPAPAAARRALEEATDVLVEGAAEETGHDAPEAPEATLLLRDLFVALPALRGSERTRGEAILARPTDGARDPYGDGYLVPSRKKCSTNFCLHYVTTTGDRPPSSSWVTTNLEVLEKVWRHQVGKMGYRAPVKDGTHGGNSKFDVYLKDIGSQGFYGYCAPEYRKKGTTGVASGYCVLDNDFSQLQYGAPPLQSLRVTAAHEFFHAVQFGYDYREDHWLMESTATWMEERVYDGVNDNRQYLSDGQVKKPGSSLDVFQPSGFAQYGNWTFWEHLGGRFGNGIVKQVWNKAGTFAGAPDHYSTQALRATIGGKGGGLAKVFGAYAASNTAPGRYYPEGSAWPKAGPARRIKLSSSERGADAKVRINHLASRSIAVNPDSTLAGKKWALRIKLDAPNRVTSPAVHVLVRNRDGAWTRKGVALTKRGHGKVVVAFSQKKVKGVTITLANASTRYRCGSGTDFACEGKPLDQGKAFKVTVKAFKR